MSANYLVDIGNTAMFCPSINTTVPLSGAVVGQWIDMNDSDSFCNVYVVAAGCSGPLQIAIQTAPGQFDIPGSGAFSGNILSGGAPLSGMFTDPTSGLAQLPTWINSGGILLVNSGLYTVPGGGGQQSSSGNGSGSFIGLVNGYPTNTFPFGINPIQHGMGGTGLTSGSYPVFGSGGIAFAAFQRNYHYARLVLLSGATAATFVQAGLVAQKITTGSGGGFYYGPLANTAVNV